MPLLEGEPIYTGGESWQQKFQSPAAVDSDAPGPYHAWHRTWHLHPGLTSTGQFETTAPVPSSVLLTRPWDAPAMRTEAASGPIAWRAAMEGVTTVSDEPWAFEIDHRNGKMKCLACCASARGECGLDTCGLKPPPIPQEFLAIGGGEGVYRPGPAQLAPQPVPGPYGCVRRAPSFNRASTALSRRAPPQRRCAPRGPPPSSPRPPRGRRCQPAEVRARQRTEAPARANALPWRSAHSTDALTRAAMSAHPIAAAACSTLPGRRRRPRCSEPQQKHTRQPALGGVDAPVTPVMLRLRYPTRGTLLTSPFSALCWLHRRRCGATLTLPKLQVAKRIAHVSKHKLATTQYP